MTQIRAAAVLLVLSGMAVSASRSAAEIVEFTYTNSYDGTEQKAVAYVPEVCKEGQSSPLIAVAHAGNGTRHSPSYYYAECEARGWLYVCPDLHGPRIDGRWCFAAMEAQHDMVDAVQYMRDHYRVDPARIYIAGRSMGGAVAAVTAAKYPDLFAAAVGGQGVYDMRSTKAKGRLKAMGGPYTPERRFAYERYSAVSFARNFRYVPLILWHGTNDSVVRPEQSEQMVTAIRRYHRFQPDVHWLLAAPYNPINFPPAWIFDQLEHYQNFDDMNQVPRFFTELDLVTDEAKGIFWLHITPARSDAFAQVRASVNDDVLSIRSTGAAQVKVDLTNMPSWLTLSKYDIRSVQPLRVIVVKDGKTVLSADIEGAETGPLPEASSGRITPPPQGLPDRPRLES